MGNPKYVPDDKARSKVEMLSAVGVPHDDIARMIGIDPKTLRLHFREELDLGSAKATAQIAQRLYQRAIGGDLGAMIFWLKARAGWREKHQIEHTGTGGGPIQVITGVPIAAITQESDE
ncbi:MAG: hypothetical protein V4636_12955 [Pseudomonadota bacterium]